MWITQHFVPWPWQTKRWRCLGTGAWCPGKRASSEHPSSFRWAGGIVPRWGWEVPSGHPGTACHLDCHSCSTKMAAWQMKVPWHRNKTSLLEGVHGWDLHAIWMQIRVRQITIEVPFEETGKCKDKSEWKGSRWIFIIHPEDANIHTDLFHLSPKLKKGKFLLIKSKRNTTKPLCTSRLKSYKFLILLKSTRDLWSPWQQQCIQPSDCLQWISDKTKWKWIDVILMQKWAVEGRSTRFIFE